MKAIVIPIIFRSATVSVATWEQDAPTLSLMVLIWNDYSNPKSIVNQSPLAPLRKGGTVNQLFTKELELLYVICHIKQHWLLNFNKILNKD